MPCRISTGLHEWLNEAPTVPSPDLVNPLSGAHARYLRWEAKTP